VSHAAQIQAVSEAGGEKQVNLRSQALCLETSRDSNGFSDPAPGMEACVYGTSI